MNVALMKYTMDQMEKEKLAQKFLDMLREDPVNKKQEMIRKMREARQKYESSRGSSIRVQEEDGQYDVQERSEMQFLRQTQDWSKLSIYWRVPL